MWIKYITIALLFFTVALLQFSFLPYFNILGNVPNLVFVLFFIFIFFGCLGGREKPDHYYEGFFLAMLAGFFLDIFSTPIDRLFLGASIIGLLMVYFFIRIVLYFLKEIQDKYFIFYFLSTFLFAFLMYSLFLYYFGFNKITVITIGYNVALAFVGFYGYRTFDHFDKKDRQLTLFK